MGSRVSTASNIHPNPVIIERMSIRSIGPNYQGSDHEESKNQSITDDYYNEPRNAAESDEVSQTQK